MTEEQQKKMRMEAKAYDFNYYHAANTPGLNKLVREVSDHWELGFIAGYNEAQERIWNLEMQLELLLQTKRK